MSDEKDKLIQKMNGLIEQPGGQQAVRFLLNTLGSVPIVGGAIAGTGQLWGEKEQQRLNETIAEWAIHLF